MATRYVALLKGVNMIGKKSITMDQLSGIFTERGFLDVRTVGVSGNVLFNVPEQQEIQAKQGREVFSIGYPHPTDPRRFGNPVTWIERTYNLEVTLREWSVVRKIAAAI